MTMTDFFDKEIFTLTPEDLLEGINDMILEMAPEGKTLDDFTGGYVQQLKNSTQFVAYFGTKEGTKNRATAKMRIQDNELDEMFMMLKIKIHDMRNETGAVMSIAQRRLAKKATREVEKSRVMGGY